MLYEISIYFGIGNNITKKHSTAKHELTMPVLGHHHLFI